MSWGDVSSPEGLKKTIFQIIAGIAITAVGIIVTAIAAGVGTYILQILNKTGFTTVASANYVAPIESLASSALLILSIVSILVGVIMIIVALLKLYYNLTV
jgi:MFS superfamily sulfate permease-like transporter